jgi:hypothetical protein
MFLKTWENISYNGVIFVKTVIWFFAVLSVAFMAIYFVNVIDHYK